MNIMDIPKKRRTNKGVQLYKIVKSNPYSIQDSCLLNATQYKGRSDLRITTDKELVLVNAFDVKIDKSESGKTYITKKQGNPLFININEVEEDLDITPISDYQREVPHDVVQQTLFE